MALQYLPYDLLLNVAQYLDLDDIRALQLTCKSLRDFSTTRPVYRHLANALLRRCRALPLKGFQRLSELTTHQLIHSVNRATLLERAWRIRTPRPISTSPYGESDYLPDTDRFKQDGTEPAQNQPRTWYKVVSSPPDEEVDWLSPITSSYTLCATKSGKVVCWDVQSDSCLAEWNPGERWELWKCRVEFEERTIYFTMAKVIAGTYDDDRVMDFVLMQLHFPESTPKSTDIDCHNALSPTSSPPIFSYISGFKTTGVVMNVFLLDPPARLLSAFVWVAATNTIGLYALLDWDLQEYVFIDTGIECVLSSNWSCILYDGNIVIHSEESEAALQHFYPISLLQEYNRTLSSSQAVPSISCRVTPPTTLTKRFIFPRQPPTFDAHTPEPDGETESDPGSPNSFALVTINDISSDPDASPPLTNGHAPHAGASANPNPFPFPPWYPESAHFVRQWWPTLPGLPRLSCTVVLLAAHDQVTHRTRFVLAQHYFRVPMSPSAWWQLSRRLPHRDESSHRHHIHEKTEENDADGLNGAHANPFGFTVHGNGHVHTEDDDEDEDPLMKLWYVSTPFEVVCVVDGPDDDDDNGASERPRPLVAVDFGHAVWIEYVDGEEERAARPPAEREPKCLRFVTFPPVVVGEGGGPDRHGVEIEVADADVDHDDPGEYLSSHMREGDGGLVRTLEIPKELDLDSVETINIDQSQGAVILSVKQGKIFILCYE